MRNEIHLTVHTWLGKSGGSFPKFLFPRIGNIPGSLLASSVQKTGFREDDKNRRVPQRKLEGGHHERTAKVLFTVRSKWPLKILSLSFSWNRSSDKCSSFPFPSLPSHRYLLGAILLGLVSLEDTSLHPPKRIIGVCASIKYTPRKFHVMYPSILFRNRVRKCRYF